METEKMQTPIDAGNGAEDPAECARQLIQMTQTLEPDQYLSIFFMRWQSREDVMKIMRERYKEADLRKIEFGLYH